MTIPARRALAAPSAPGAALAWTHKYFQVAKITWKSMLAYQVDTWLGAAVSGFRVLLAFLLWSAVYAVQGSGAAGQEQVAGYTLPMMITYSLLATMFSRLQNQDALAWQLAGEVREGQFSKYLVHPVSVIGYFISAGLGRWSYLLLINGLALGAWALVFSNWLALAENKAVLLWLVILLPLGALSMLLLNHLIALLSLKYTDITGFMILKGSVIEFLSGAFVPLSLLPPVISNLLRLTPFYYIVYYPANLALGRASEAPWLAALILLGWCAALYGLGQVWFRRARKAYEGVGI